MILGQIGKYHGVSTALNAQFKENVALNLYRLPVVLSMKEVYFNVQMGECYVTV